MAPPGLASSHKCQHFTGPLNLMRLRLWGSGVVMAGPCALGNGQSLSRYLQVPLHSHGWLCTFRPDLTLSPQQIAL